MTIMTLQIGPQVRPRTRFQRGFQISPLIFLFLFVAVAKAQSGDPEAGKTVAMQGNNRGAAACMACHGADGSGQEASGFPQLAGLNSQYLLQQIQDYRSQKRLNPVMMPIAKSLSDKEAVDVAVYFSKLQPKPVAPSKAPTEAQLKLGRDIAETGMWDKGVPACYSCHGPQGVGVGTQFPRITFQHKSYLVQQLNAWKTNQRKNDPNNLMKTVAQKMSPNEIEAVASFLSSQKLAGAKEGSAK